ncbi:hypothetical protein C6P45_001819 [Maudiozyma exigua]|uniref:RRM Nup35-type domain-containing protein n=1 Tax=Maudiozyma exigua TaxID=34358 RepID=A0A9P6WD25_MAUEX|nr:hypothetical protein C6P45_001819 [Kazachstania exigua]
MNNNRFANVSVLSQQQNGNGQNFQQNGVPQSSTLSNTTNPMLNGQTIGNNSLNSTSTQSLPLNQFNNSNNFNNNNNNIATQQFSNLNTNSMTSNNSTVTNSNGGTNGLINGQKEPQWFNNPTKRAIPQTIVKRTIRTQNSSNDLTHSQSATNLSNRSGFDTMSFGSRKNKPIFNNSNLQNLNSDNILGDSNEAPPMTSIHDWDNEDPFGAGHNQDNNNNNNNSHIAMNNQSLLMSNMGTPRNENSKSVPNLFKNANAFDRTPQDTKVNSANDSVSLKDSNKTNGTKNILSDFIGSINNKDKKATTDTTTTAPTTTTTTSVSQQEETAIIVFGYPESISNLIITHFSNFGSILEDFQVLRSPSGINKFTLKNKNGQNNINSNDERKYPIFTGDGWVKITYDSRQSAVRALQENGSVFSGTLIGCVPYSRKAVEKLASCKIDKYDNIGENDINLSGTMSPLQNLDNDVINITTPIGTNTMNDDSMFTASLKDGTNFQTANKENNPVMPKNVFLPNHKLTVNDGKSLFVHNTDTNNHNFIQSLENKMRQQENPINVNDTSKQNSGLLHSVNNWLFGWGNL